MQSRSRFVTIAALAVMPSLRLLGADLVTPEFKAQEERLLAQTAKNLNESCETSIAVSFDWKSFEGVDLSGHSPVAYCEPPLKTLRGICDLNEAKKAKTKEKVKAVTCVYAGKATEKEQDKEDEIKDMTVRNGTLVWRFNWSAGNLNDYMIDFFRKFL